VEEEEEEEEEEGVEKEEEERSSVCVRSAKVRNPRSSSLLGEEGREEGVAGTTIGSRASARHMRTR